MQLFSLRETSFCNHQTVYAGAIPLETDLLNTNRNTLVGLGKLAAAMLGTSTLLNGLAVFRRHRQRCMCRSLLARFTVCKTSMAPPSAFYRGALQPC
ncbi:hypothetical protein XfCFBP8356_006945 [Xylella fastidiosa subsp. sandyi]|uniref:hypothetical protein n=1 Tax=Xylella fastidiosa TaxID=2371 RepID=UPI0002E1A1AD|nr:hypothetical protein [Xylella fastidiosa]UIN28740.1 hypothetical protein IUD23_04435 [Xylella fastidiosa subsp. morus]UIT39775.1 hypothetical protein LZ755_04450 [Xylella fastidiosa subsp. morus]UIT44216.1 hypothetical protein LZ758_04440 [Xylella fastidiosa subsp. morus]WCF20986.1 hypothetical protein OK114_07305 [Xylella fastidiosa subsp. fastidiosa]WDF08402.1 hypothetical protein PT013_06710 [Xylella fastidiosa subsp. fastidiosa]